MMNALLTLFIYVFVLGIFVWLVHYLVDSIPIADPFGRWAKILAVVFAVLILLMLMLSVVNDSALLPRFR
jgi:hypothetical protein